MKGKIDSLLALDYRTVISRHPQCVYVFSNLSMVIAFSSVPATSRRCNNQRQSEGGWRPVLCSPTVLTFWLSSGHSSYFCCSTMPMDAAASSCWRNWERCLGSKLLSQTKSSWVIIMAFNICLHVLFVRISKLVLEDRPRTKVISLPPFPLPSSSLPLVTLTFLPPRLKHKNTMHICSCEKTNVHSGRLLSSSAKSKNTNLPLS